VLSELVNNSVVHGPGKPIRVWIERRSDGVIHGEVEDYGDGEVVMRQSADQFHHGGFGLRLVDAMVDRWGTCPGGTHVWFEMSGSRAEGDHARLSRE